MRSDAHGFFWSDPVGVVARGERPARALPAIPDTGWHLPTSFPRLDAAKALCFDVETHDIGLAEGKGPGWAWEGGGEVIGLGVATDDGAAWYFPIEGRVGELRREGFARQAVMAWAQDELGRPGQPKLGANIMYDIGWMRREGVLVRGEFHDVQFAEPLLNEHATSYSLGTLAEQYGLTEGGKGDQEEALYSWLAAAYGGKPNRRGQGGNIYRGPSTLVGPYALADVTLPFAIWRQQWRRLEDDGLLDLYRMECDLIPLLVEMRWRGIRVDVAGAQARSEALGREAAELRLGLGPGADPNSSIWLASAYDAEGIAYPRTDKGNPSFPKEWLAAQTDALSSAILDIRRLEKVKSTFIDGYILGLERQGRIHGSFHPLRTDENGTVSGRLCVHADTLVKTQRGPVRIVDLRVGEDLVWTHKERWRRVLNRFSKGHEAMIDFMGLRCTLGHHVLTTSGWQSVSEVIGYGKVDNELSGVQGAHCCPLPIRFQTDGRRGGAHLGERVRPGDLRQGSPTGPFARNVQTREEIEVRSVEDRGTEPDEREIWRSAPQFQGRAGMRSFRIYPRSETGLVHWAREQPRLSAFGNNGAGFGVDRDTEGNGGSPQGWPSIEQRIEQPGIDDPGRACFSSPSEVYDIEVEEDHSYAACGLYNHNSSSEPNLQNLPARDPEVRGWTRGLFLPEEGERLFSPDYSQLEYRLMVHRAVGKGAEEARQRYRDDPATDYHTFTQELVRELTGRRLPRKQIKNVNFGKIFGMGERRLIQMLGFSEDEAHEFFRAYDMGIPFARATLEALSREARSQGFIRTIGGRLARFPFFEQQGRGMGRALPLEEARAEYGPGIVRAFTHKALNAYTQGGGGDIIKRAMLACWRAGECPLLTVHDELVFSLPYGEEGDRRGAAIIGLMEGVCQELNIPLLAVGKYGPNWGEVK